MPPISSVDDRPVSAPPPGEIDRICCIGAEACVLITICSSDDAETLARRIHDIRTSPRGCFRPIDCGLPIRALDEELFGPLARRLPAARSTLFLKEVGKLTVDQQVRLLKLLRQTAQACWPSPPPARVVAYTSEGLFERVVDGSFDADLFYRLNTIHLYLCRRDLHVSDRHAIDQPGEC